MNVRFMHLRRNKLTYVKYEVQLSRAEYGGCTVAYQQMDNFVYRVGIGRCISYDRYTKRDGRVAALNNLHETQQLVIIEADDDLYEALISYAQLVVGRSMRPVIFGAFERGIHKGELA